MGISPDIKLDTTDKTRVLHVNEKLPLATSMYSFRYAHACACINVAVM